MTDNDIVLGVLAGQATDYLIHPAASAFAAAGLPNPSQVTQILTNLETGGLCTGSDQGWSITDAGRQAAPTLPDGTPEPLPEPSVPQRVLAAIDALDPETASVADIIQAVQSALAAN